MYTITKHKYCISTTKALFSQNKMGVIFVCNKLLLKANNIIINASLGLDVEQQEFLYLVLALLILAVGRDL